MFSDQKTTISELRELCQKFRLERNWQKASAATFAKDIAVEAGELLDHFVWDEDAYLHDPLIAKEVHHELVDVLYGVLAMSDILKIDLSTTLQEKIKILAKKYPQSKVVMVDRDLLAVKYAGNNIKKKILSKVG